MTSTTIFAGRPVSADLAARIALLPAQDRRRLEQRLHQRQSRRWIGGRELSDVFEAQLFAQDTPGFKYYRALMRLDRRAA